MSEFSQNIQGGCNKKFAKTKWRDLKKGLIKKVQDSQKGRGNIAWNK